MHLTHIVIFNNSKGYEMWKYYVSEHIIHLLYKALWEITYLSHPQPSVVFLW